MLNSKEIQAMETLKNALISFPVLELSYSGGHMTFDTDARNMPIGCVLLQKRPGGTTKPLSYWSYSLSNTEKTI